MSGPQPSVHTCRGIVRGKARGKVLRSSDGICFYTVEPESGVVAEKGHPLAGRCVAGTALIFPHGKGSSVVQLDGLYQLVKHGVAPTSLIVESLDTVLVACAVIMDIPLVADVDASFYDRALDGALVEVDANAGTLTLLGSSAGGSTTSAGSETHADH
jgi:predicted aconitase with swiveling domain